MEQPPPMPQEEAGGSERMFVKVMTDEQMEVLRKQIVVYATICQQLAQLHKSLTAHNDLPGVRWGNLYCDSLLAPGAHKIAGRQRWSPTPMQLQILERIFDEGTGTPNKLRIKEIATELSQHGQISETNVYNWFQNRRARSKRKQQAAPANETAIVSRNMTKTKEDSQSQHIRSSRTEDVCLQNSHANSSVHSVDPSTDELEPALPLEGRPKLGCSFEQMSFYGSVLPNPGMEQLMGKMEVSGNYNPNYMQQDDYHMAG